MVDAEGVSTLDVLALLGSGAGVVDAASSLTEARVLETKRWPGSAPCFDEHPSAREARSASATSVTSHLLLIVRLRVVGVDAVEVVQSRRIAD